MPRMKEALTAFARRFPPKWRQIPFHEKLNITVATSSFFVGTMAIVLTVIAVTMTREQGQIAKRQAEIAERQMQILQKQLVLDARLIVVGEAASSGNGVTWSVKNRGLGPKPFKFAIIFSQYTQTLGLSCRGIDGSSVHAESAGPYTTLGIVRITEIAGETSIPIAHCEALTPEGRVGHHGFPFTWQIFAEDETFKSVEPTTFWVVIPPRK